MKLKLFLLMSVALVCIAACSAKGKSDKNAVCAEWLTPDSIAYSKLGKNLSTILFSPKEVKCYLIKNQDTIAEGQLEPYFAKDSLLKKLSKEEIAVLQYNLLSSGKNYTNDTIVVMSPYAPCLDFEFSKKKEKAHVIISLSDFTWTVLYDDKKQFNFNYHNESIERFCKFYLTNQ